MLRQGEYFLLYEAHRGNGYLSKSKSWILPLLRAFSSNEGTCVYVSCFLSRKLKGT